MGVLNVGHTWDEAPRQSPFGSNVGVHPNAAEPIAASIAEHGMTLRAVLFHQQRLDEVEEAASHHKSASANLDTLDLPGLHQFVGPGPTQPELVGCLFY